jgi:succinate-acetate transporter protein
MTEYAGDSLPAQIVLRPVGHPLPLGFLALGVGTLALSALQLGWVAPTEGRVVALTALAFTAPLQLLASVLGFQARDTVAGSGMGVLSGAWAVLGLVLLTSPPGSTSGALGVVLLGVGAALAVPAVSATGKVVAAVVLGTASTRFAVTGVAQLTGSARWQDAAGVIGLLLALLAMYAATAFALEDVHQRAVLPLVRRGRGRTDQTARECAADLATAPGVRTQL